MNKFKKGDKIYYISDKGEKIYGKYIKTEKDSCFGNMIWAMWGNVTYESWVPEARVRVDKTTHLPDYL